MNSSIDDGTSSATLIQYVFGDRNIVVGRDIIIHPSPFTPLERFSPFSRFSIFCAVFSGLLLCFGAAEIEPSARTENEDHYNHANYPLRQPQIPVGS
jgi:hypothetical protein